MALALALLCCTPACAQTLADVTLDGTDIYPESLSADSAGRLYIGSIKGVIFRTEPGGTIAEPWIQPNAENGILALLGVLVDEKHGTLWACSFPAAFRNPPATGVTALHAFDLKTGAPKGRWPFPGNTGTCNDIAVAADGTAYAADTGGGRIVTLAPGASALTVFAEDPALKGIDGIAFAEDGTLYMNNVITHVMARVERDAAGKYTGLKQLTLSEPVKAPDGLRPVGGSRFLQAEGGSGRIAEVTIAGDTATIRTVYHKLASSPGVAPARGGAYAIEGKIGYLVDPKLKGQDPGPFVVHAFPYTPAK